MIRGGRSPFGGLAQAFRVVRFARKHSTAILALAAMYLLAVPAAVAAISIGYVDNNVLAGLWAFVIIEAIIGLLVYLSRAVK